MRSLLAAILAGVIASTAAAQTDPQPGPNDWGPLPTSRTMTTTVSRIEPRFSAAASLVSGGKRVEARCWSTTDWRRIRGEWATAGYDVFFVSYVNNNDPPPLTRAHLSPSTCTLLGRLTYQRAWRPTRRKRDLAAALVTLAHEAQHIRGTHDEPTAECWGMQRARIVARSLGLTLAESNALVATYWRLSYSTQSAAFRSVECRQGGALDVNVTRAFP